MSEPLSPPPSAPPSPALTPPNSQPIQWQALFFQVLLLTALGATVMWLLVRLRMVTAPILIGLFIAYALNPVVVRLRRWRVPPVLALGVPVLAVLSLAVVFFAVVVPSMAHEFVYASQHAPQQLYNLVLRADPWYQSHFGEPLSSLVDYHNLSGLTQSIATEVFGPASSALAWVLSSARDVLLAIGNTALVVVVAFFLLDDYEHIVDLTQGLVPRGKIDEVRRVLGRIDDVLAGFLRGELLLWLAATAAFTVGLLALDVPFAIVVGPLAGIMYLVPYIGVVVGVVLCLILSALAGHSFLHVIGVVSLFAVFYTVDLLFITPRVIGNRAGLKPVVVLLGIIAFGQLFGIIGVLIAVPALACGRILLMEAVDRYRASAAYLGTAVQDAPVPTGSEDIEKPRDSAVPGADS